MKQPQARSFFEQKVVQDDVSSIERVDDGRVRVLVTRSNECAASLYRFSLPLLFTDDHDDDVPVTAINNECRECRSRVEGQPCL